MVQALRHRSARCIGRLVLLALLWHAFAWVGHHHQPGDLGTSRTDCAVCATAHVPALQPSNVPLPELPLLGVAPAPALAQAPRAVQIRTGSPRAPPPASCTLVA